MERVNTPVCEQATELISFLYNELSTAEAQTFQRHMAGCNACSDEFAAFGGVRSAMIAWRDESLGVASHRPQFQDAMDRTTIQRPSAVAAFRQFFSLSPLWMRGAVAFATLLFVVFAGLALANLRQSAPPVLVAKADDQRNVDPKELSVLVEQRVKEELARLTNSSQQTTTPQVAVNNATWRTPSRRTATRHEVIANSPARRPLTKVEREQLAADLRLVSSNSDGDLDLLDDRMN